MNGSFDDITIMKRFNHLMLISMSWSIAIIKQTKLNRLGESLPEQNVNRYHSHSIFKISKSKSAFMEFCFDSKYIQLQGLSELERIRWGRCMAFVFIFCQCLLLKSIFDKISNILFTHLQSYRFQRFDCKEFLGTN